MTITWRTLLLMLALVAYTGWWGMSHLLERERTQAHQEARQLAWMEWQHLIAPPLDAAVLGVGDDTVVAAERVSDETPTPNQPANQTPNPQSHIVKAEANAMGATAMQATPVTPRDTSGRPAYWADVSGNATNAGAYRYDPQAQIEPAAAPASFAHVRKQGNPSSATPQEAHTSAATLLVEPRIQPQPRRQAQPEPNPMQRRIAELYAQQAPPRDGDRDQCRMIRRTYPEAMLLEVRIVNLHERFTERDIKRWVTRIDGVRAACVWREASDAGWNILCAPVSHQAFLAAMPFEAENLWDASTRRMVVDTRLMEPR